MYFLLFHIYLNSCFNTICCKKIVPEKWPLKYCFLISKSAHTYSLSGATVLQKALHDATHLIAFIPTRFCGPSARGEDICAIHTQVVRLRLEGYV